MAQLDFNPNEVEDFNGIPAGFHNVRIVESDIKPTKAGTGKILTLTMQVEDGENKGRRHWERLNIINPNATAQNIAHRRLKDIMSACKVDGTLTDSSTLHNIPFSAKFLVEEDDYGKKSVLKKLAPYGVPPTGRVGMQERFPQNGGEDTSQVGSGGEGSLPWEKN